MRRPMRPPSPILRQFACENAQTLWHAFERVSDVSWVDGCTVDVARLVLEVRVTASWRTRSAIEAQLDQVQRIASGHGE